MFLFFYISIFSKTQMHRLYHLPETDRPVLQSMHPYLCPKQ